MPRYEEAEQLLHLGLHPSAIAGRMGISTKSVIKYLCTRVGEGFLRLSDLYFSWSSEQRGILVKAGEGRYPDDRLLASNNLTRDELALFESLRSSRALRNDMYGYVASLEVVLHALVRERLERELGADETGWWRQGIPPNIRAKCATRREEDDEPCRSPYAYTTLIDLSTVISKNWSVFEKELPKKYRGNRNVLESDMARLNRIRNAVMHPVKDRAWSEEDFEFVREISLLFELRNTQ